MSKPGIITNISSGSVYSWLHTYAREAHSATFEISRHHRFSIGLSISRDCRCDVPKARKDAKAMIEWMTVAKRRMGQGSRLACLGVRAEDAASKREEAAVTEIADADAHIRISRR